MFGHPILILHKTLDPTQVLLRNVFATNIILVGGDREIS